MATKIQIKNLRKIYDTPERRVHALENINLDVEDGEFLCLVGLSGCGKTTLLNILAGFVEITAGDVVMDGKPLTDDYDQVRIRLQRLRRRASTTPIVASTSALISTSARSFRSSF